MKTRLSLISSIFILILSGPMNGAPFPSNNSLNLIVDGSYECGCVPNNTQGNLPDTWFHVTAIVPGADVYSSNPAIKKGMLPGTWNNWPSGMQAADGLRFVAGCDFATGGVKEGFGNELTSPTVTGHAYRISGQFRFSDMHIRRGVYDIYLAVDALTTAELSDPNKAAYIGSLGRNSNWTQWTYDAMHFVAPDAYSHVIMQPRYVELGSTYPGCDDWELVDLGPASLHGDACELQVITGGAINFSLDAGPSHGNRPYLLLGSLSGVEPGVPLPGGAATLPLNWDLFTNLVALNANTPIFSNFHGTLDPSGTAMAQFNTFGPLPPELTGFQLSFAFMLFAPTDFASNGVPVEIKP